MVWPPGCQPGEAGSIPVVCARCGAGLRPVQVSLPCGGSLIRPTAAQALLAQSGQSTWFTPRVSGVRILDGALLLIVKWTSHELAKLVAQVRVLVGRRLGRLPDSGGKERWKSAPEKLPRTGRAAVASIHGLLGSTPRRGTMGKKAVALGSHAEMSLTTERDRPPMSSALVLSVYTSPSLRGTSITEVQAALTRPVGVRFPGASRWFASGGNACGQSRSSTSQHTPARCRRLHARFVSGRAGFDSWCWLGDVSVLGRTRGCDPRRAGSTPVRHTTSVWNPRTSHGWYTTRGCLGGFD